MGRRGFDFLHGELSVALGAAVPRYPLWVALHESGRDPEALDREDLLTFCHRDLQPFLHARCLVLPDRAGKRLERSIQRFDPRFPTPEEWLGGLTG